MLESLLAGQALILHVNPLLVWGPAALLALIAVLLILWPQRSGDRRVVATSVIMRDQPGRRPGRIIVGVVLAGLAVALATVLREPQVTITAEGLSCRPWAQTIAWRDVAQLRSERIGFTGRPVVRLVPSREIAAERRGPLSQIPDRLIGIVRGPSRIGASGAICGLDNLTLAHDQARPLATVAWGRARFGPFPDVANPQALAAWCTRNPGPRCAADALSADLAACRGSDSLGEQACRYERFAAPLPAASGRQPARPPAPQPRSQSPAPPTPSATPAPPPTQPPAPASPPRAQPPVQPPQAQPAPSPPAKPPAPEGPAGKPAR